MCARHGRENLEFPPSPLTWSVPPSYISPLTTKIDVILTEKLASLFCVLLVSETNANQNT